MTEAGLKVIFNDMAALKINYDFLEWKGKLVYPYFVGEYQEVPTPNECGEVETNFILTGFARGQNIDLEREKKKIKKFYPKTEGRTVITEDGTVMAIFYSDSFMVPTGNEELKKMQINLTIKEWSVN